jgi:hypothetical protein
MHWERNSWTIMSPMDLSHHQTTALHMPQAVIARSTLLQIHRVTGQHQLVSDICADRFNVCIIEPLSDIWKDGLHPTWAVDQYWANGIYDQLQAA